MDFTIWRCMLRLNFDRDFKKLIFQLRSVNFLIFSKIIQNIRHTYPLFLFFFIVCYKKRLPLQRYNYISYESNFLFLNLY